MDTKILRSFLKLAEYKNFTVAADELYMAQSTLSHNIAELEKELNMKLFHRTTRSVSLTPAGELLARHSTELIERLDGILLEMQNAESGLSGELKIGYIYAPFKKLLPELLKAYRRECPDIKIQTSHLNMGPMISSLELGAIDIGFTNSFNIVNKELYESRTVFQDGMSLAVPKGHRLGNTSEIDWKTVSREPLITMQREESPYYHLLLMKVCAARGISLNIVRWAQKPEAIMVDVEAGLGIAITPSSMKELASNNVCFIDIEGDDTKFDAIVVWRKDAVNPAIRSFISFFDSYAF